MERSKRRIREGLVISTKMNKTAIVEVERSLQHPEYGKVIRRKSKFKVHDEENLCHRGDMVRIMETRPISKDKRWRVVEIIGKGRVTEG